MNDNSDMPPVLFRSTRNSASSQRAEAIRRNRSGNRFEIAIAGMDPKGANPPTLCSPVDNSAAFKGTQEERLEKFCEIRDRLAVRIEEWIAEVDRTP